jgi:hypothetical protein
MMHSCPSSSMVVVETVHNVIIHTENSFTVILFVMLWIYLKEKVLKLGK